MEKINTYRLVSTTMNHDLPQYSWGNLFFFNIPPQLPSPPFLTMILLKPPPYVYHSWQRTVLSERKQAIGHQFPILPFPGTNSPCLSNPLGSREEATPYSIPFPPPVFCLLLQNFYCFLSLSTPSPSVHKIPISVVSLSSFHFSFPS